jgi:hypothetical protein
MVSSWVWVSVYPNCWIQWDLSGYYWSTSAGAITIKELGV